MNREHVFVQTIIGVLAGMFIGVIAPTAAIPIIIGMAAVVVVINYFILQSCGFWKRILPVIFFIVMMIVGYVYGSWYLRYQAPRIVPFYYNQTVTVSGTVTNADDRYTGTIITVAPETLSGITIAHPSFEKINITVSKTDAPAIGDTVTVYGKLIQPESFITDSGSVFDYREYLGSEHVHGIMRNSTIDIMGRDHAIHLSIMRNLSYVQDNIRDHLEMIFPNPVSALFAGIMIGDKSLFSPELLDVFRNTGLIHIMVLSGSNIALVAGFVFIFSRRYGYRMRYVVAGIVMIAFVAMTGFAPPSTRALIMMLVGYAAHVLVRPQSATRAFMLTVLIMAIMNPLVLPYNVSFHLSVLATIAIMYVAPLIEMRATRIPERYELRAIFSQTLSSQIIVVPYTIITMGMISWVALPLNMVIVPIIGILTITGFVLLAISYVSLSIAWVVALPASLIGSWIVNISTHAAHVPGSYMYLSSIPTLFLIGYYIFTSYIIYTRAQTARYE